MTKKKWLNVATLSDMENSAGEGTRGAGGREHSGGHGIHGRALMRCQHAPFRSPVLTKLETEPQIESTQRPIRPIGSIGLRTQQCPFQKGLNVSVGQTKNPQ